MPRSRTLKLPQYVAELREAGMQVLGAELGLDAKRADQVAMAIVSAICFRNAKSTVYIPEASGLENAVRNAAIWAEYQQDNPEPPYTRRFTQARTEELAAKHDLTTQMVYTILRDQRADEMAERQAGLWE